MDILKAEIARKRKLLEEKNILVIHFILSLCDSIQYYIKLPSFLLIHMFQNPTKKYFKRGELLAKEEEEYLKKYGPQKDNESSSRTEKSEKGKSYSLFSYLNSIQNWQNTVYSLENFLLKFYFSEKPIQ